MAEPKKILRVATIIAGTLLFILSVIRFIKVKDLNFARIILTLYFM